MATRVRPLLRDPRICVFSLSHLPFRNQEFHVPQRPRGREEMDRSAGLRPTERLLGDQLPGGLLGRSKANLPRAHVLLWPSAQVGERAGLSRGPAKSQECDLVHGEHSSPSLTGQGRLAGGPGLLRGTQAPPHPAFSPAEHHLGPSLAFSYMTPFRPSFQGTSRSNVLQEFAPSSAPETLAWLFTSAC